MKLNLYDENLNRIAIIQEQFVSVYWEEGYNTVGSFSLELQATDEYKEKVKTDRYIGRDDRATLMVIKSVQTESRTIIATGKEAKRVLDDVAFVGTIPTNQLVAGALKSAYNSTEGFPRLTFADSDLQDVYHHQISNKSVLELCTKLCQDTDVGFRTVKSGTGIVLELYKPVRNPNLVFAEDYGNLNDVSVTLSTENYKNYAVVLGQDEGTTRTRIDVDIRQNQSEQKRAIIIDARDLQNDVQIDLGEVEQDTSTLTPTQTIAKAEEMEEEYLARLQERGLQKLLEKTKTWQCTFLPLVKEFGSSYDLGDILTIYLKKYDITLTARVTMFSQKQQRNQIETEISVGSLTVRA